MVEHDLSRAEQNTRPDTEVSHIQGLARVSGLRPRPILGRTRARNHLDPRPAHGGGRPGRRFGGGARDVRKLRIHHVVQPPDITGSGRVVRRTRRDPGPIGLVCGERRRPPKGPHPVEEGVRPLPELETAMLVGACLRTHCAIDGSSRTRGLAPPRTARNVKPGVVVFWDSDVYSPS
jgi:hypothetical protein